MATGYDIDNAPNGIVSMCYRCCAIVIDCVVTKCIEKNSLIMIHILARNCILVDKRTHSPSVSSLFLYFLDSFLCFLGLIDY